MMKQITLNVLVVLSLLIIPIALTTGSVSAADPDPPKCPDGDSAKAQVLQGIGQTGNHCDDSQVNGLLRTIVQILSLIVGITSVMVILIAGFKYMTSGGEAGKVTNAKNTLLYALVGLLVAATAQLLIHFVLFQANDVGKEKPKKASSIPARNISELS